MSDYRIHDDLRDILLVLKKIAAALEQIAEGPERQSAARAEFHKR